MLDAIALLMRDRRMRQGQPKQLRIVESVADLVLKFAQIWHKDSAQTSAGTAYGRAPHAADRLCSGSGLVNECGRKGKKGRIRKWKIRSKIKIKRLRIKGRFLLDYSERREKYSITMKHLLISFLAIAS